MRARLSLIIINKMCDCQERFTFASAARRYSVTISYCHVTILMLMLILAVSEMTIVVFLHLESIFKNPAKKNWVEKNYPV